MIQHTLSSYEKIPASRNSTASISIKPNPSYVEIDPLFLFENVTHILLLHITFLLRI